MIVDLYLSYQFNYYHEIIIIQKLSIVYGPRWFLLV
jgi:hypothetical protein